MNVRTIFRIRSCLVPGHFISLIFQHDHDLVRNLYQVQFFESLAQSFDFFCIKIWGHFHLHANFVTHLGTFVRVFTNYLGTKSRIFLFYKDEDQINTNFFRHLTSCAREFQVWEETGFLFMKLCRSILYQFQLFV